MNVIITPYDPAWPDKFREEAALLRKVFGGLLVTIHHVGSTSVPGLAAKPIIDMMPVVTDINLLDSMNPRMIELGYESMGEFGIPGRRYFRKGGDYRTHQAHAFEQSNVDAITRHLAFRDYLRAHPAVAEEYGRLKTGLALRFPTDIESYMNGKDAFIKAVEKKALEWYKKK